jgi:hypothetical protein
MQGNAMDHNGLSHKQHKAIAALLSEPTIAGAAARVGVNETTLHRWLSDSAFNDVYRQARCEAVGQAVARLQQFSSGAVYVLATVMADKHTPPSTRVIAAKAVIEYAIKAVELEDLEARIAALEASLAHRN